MRRIVPALLAGLVMSGVLFAHAGGAQAANGGYTWVPFFCKDNPGDRQCKSR
jgi:hypothetical protein